jgi:hypothetical protein
MLLAQHPTPTVGHYAGVICGGPNNQVDAHELGGTKEIFQVCSASLNADTVSRYVSL